MLALSCILNFLRFKTDTFLLCLSRLSSHQGDGPVSLLHIDQICIGLLGVDPECHHEGICTLLLISHNSDMYASQDLGLLLLLQTSKRKST